MNPPDERPETVILVLSTLRAGSVTAWAPSAPSAAAAARTRSNFLKVIEISLKVEGTTTPHAPVSPGVPRETNQKAGAAAPVEQRRSALVLDRHMHLRRLDFLDERQVGHRAGTRAL